MNRCLAIHNKAKGFDQNHNAGDIIMNNCTGMTSKALCGEKSYSYRIYEAIASGHEVRLTNCIAINDNDATDKRDKTTGEIKPGEHGKYGEYGRFEVDETLEGLTVVCCEFQKASPDQFVDVTNDAELTAPRDEDGELPEMSFAHLREGSFLIDAGAIVEPANYRGIEVAGITYEGEAPDLGAFEYNGPVTTGIRLVSQQCTEGSLRLIQTQGGIVLLTVDGGDGSDRYQATLYDASGRMLGRHKFCTATTAIRLPSAANGLVVLKVEGSKGYRAAVKAMVR
jgi:hypothetical protein